MIPGEHEEAYLDAGSHVTSIHAIIDGEQLEGVLCPTCGALVFEEEKHMVWHDRLTSLSKAVARIDSRV